MDDPYHTERIHSTLESLGIGRDSLLVVGGAALALYGVRPPSDVDILVPAGLFVAMHKEQQTPSGTILQRGAHGKDYILAAPAANGHHLPVDIICDYQTYPGSSIRGYDEQFRERIAASPTSDEGWHHLTLEELLAQYKSRGLNQKAREARRQAHPHLKLKKSA